MTASDRAGLSRRHFLRNAALSGAALAASRLPDASAAGRSGRPRVAVIGAGPGGLTAAHELAERGFAVTVVERKALGGKARSIPVPGTAAGGRRDLPGEHEIVAEVWAQMKASLDDTGTNHLREGLISSWFLDPAISYPQPGVVCAANDEPLLINTVGSWDHRPEATTGVPNLFLAADYVRTDIDLATMESANEAARRAVNSLLDASGSREAHATVFTLHQPPEFEAAKAVDRELFRNGQRNAFDVHYPGGGAG